MRLSHLTFVRSDNTQMLVGSPQPRVFCIQPQNEICDIFTAAMVLANAYCEDHPSMAPAKMYFASLYRQALSHLDPERMGSAALKHPEEPTT